MAFCTSCGASIDAAARFCTQCGAPAAPAAPSTTSSASAGAAVQPALAQPRPAQGSNAVKIILIIVVVIIGLGILGSMAAFFAVRKFARSVRVDSSSGRTRVETPFGTVATDDANEVAKQLGVDVYPGARSLKGSSAVNIAGMKVANARFESEDAPDKVMEFYRRRFPRSNINVSDDNDKTVVFSNNQGMIAVKVRARGDGSLIEISRVGGAVMGGDDKE